MWQRFVFLVLLMSVFTYAWRTLDRIPIEVIGQPSTTGPIRERLEQPFFEQLAASTQLPLDVVYRTSDSIGFKDTHQLLMVKSGNLDLISLRFVQNASVEPTLLGIDLIGLTSDFKTARAVANAYAPVLDRRLQQVFNGKLLGVWPFGPQVFFCRTAVKGLQDLAGLKVRVGNENYAPLIAAFGATPSVIPFEDVEQALKNRLVDCAITSAGSGRAAGWAKHATHFFPLGTQLGVNGYVISLRVWEQLTAGQKTVLEQAFQKHVNTIWELAAQTHQDESSCLVGGPCKSGVPDKLVQVPPTAHDHQLLREAFEVTTLKDWTARCDKVHKGCAEEWKRLMAPILKTELKTQP